MADLAIAHPDLSMRGGAENVCMHVIEALQDEHDLTLLTLSRPDFEALDEYYRTDVRPPTVRIVGAVGPTLRRRAGHRLARLQAALLGRALRRYADEYDAVVSTKNEFEVDGPSLQFVHSPQFAGTDPGLDEQSLASAVYQDVCAHLSGVDDHDFEETKLLANSEWTARIVARAYDVEPEPVYPPVKLQGIPERSWSERESGFLTVGRVGPSKNVLRNVEIVSRLRERGHDVHLHVVGPITDGEYARRVRETARGLEFVSLDGAVSRDRLLELIGSHRYGLHGRPYEHFGIVVAEFAGGGAIPFAPDSGGQVEILDGDPNLLYESTDDAVETIVDVLSDPDRQARLREELDGTQREFGPERFETTIASAIEEVVT